MSDNRNLDIEEQLSILFDDIDDSAAKAAEEAQKAAEAALDSVSDAVESVKSAEEAPVFTEVPEEDFISVKKPEALDSSVKAAETEIEKMAGEVRNVRESIEDAAAQDAVFVETEAPEVKKAAEAVQNTAEAAKAAADDTKIRKEEYKGIDFDSFESVIGDDDDEEALIPEDLPERPRAEREADDEFDDDDEDDEDEIGGKSSTPKRASSGSTSRRSTQTRNSSEDRKKESAKFWIFTAIVALIVAGAVLFILWSRGIIGGGREAQPSSSEPSSSETEPSSSETEPSTEPSSSETEPSTEPSSSETEQEEPSEDETDEVSAEKVLENYNNLFMVTGTGTLNVRQEPNAGSRIIGTIDEYGGGDILEQAGEWYRVNTGGLTGYVNGSYIAGAQDAKDLLADHAVQQVRINSENGVRIRTAPNTDSDTLDTAGNNTLWEYLGEEDGFYKIRFNDTTEGYVSTDYSTVGWFLKEAIPYYE